jgi:hypothetical protein
MSPGLSAFRECLWPGTVSAASSRPYNFGVVALFNSGKI